MKAWERWALHSGLLVAAVSGLLYGAVRYFLKVQGDFGPEPHPWQAPLQHAHVLLVPWAVFALGLAIRGHAGQMLKHGVTRGRRSGLSLIGLIAPMVLAGYAVQVVTGSAPRMVAAWVHDAAGVLFLAAYAAHWLARRRARVRRGKDVGVPLAVGPLTPGARS